MLKTLRELPEVELKRRNFELSPQGIIVKMEDNKRPMVPQEMRQKILQENHDVPIVGHVGIQRIVDLVKRTYWWRGLWSDAAHYVRSCPVCQRMKSDNRKKAGALQAIPLPRAGLAANDHRSGDRFTKIGGQDRSSSMPWTA